MKYRHRTICHVLLNLSAIFLISDPSFGQQTKGKPSLFKFLNKDSVDECEAVTVAKTAAANDGKMIIGECCCAEARKPTRAEIVRDAGAVLNSLERHIEEWGHASFSDVVLIPDFVDRENNFEISNAHDYKHYENYIRTSRQGFSDVTEKIVTSIAGSAGIGLNRTVDKSDNTITNITQLEPPFSSAENLAEFRKIVALEESDNPGLSGVTSKIQDLETKLDSFITKLGADPKIGGSFGNSLSESDIQALASSTTVTGKVLNFMSNPVGLSDLHQAYIGMSQVSVSPGWRTRRDYYCEVQVVVEYARKKKNEVEYKNAWDLSLTDTKSLLSGSVPIPSVFAAFPLAQAQIIDSKYTSDTYNTMMLSVAAQLAATKPIKGSLFLRRMKHLNQQLQTRQALPVVVPSSDGKSITYRFQPSVHAQIDPTSKRSKPGWSLNPVSVPVLLVVVCEKDHLIDWDNISFTYSTRWVPMKASQGVNKVFNRFDKPLFPNRRLSNRPRLEKAATIDYMVCNYFWMQESVNFLSLETRARVLNLRNLIRSHRSIKEIPCPAPQIHDISPTRSTIEALCDTGVSISGRYFYGIGGLSSTEDLEVTVAGVPLQIMPGSTNSRLFAKVDHAHLDYLANYRDGEMSVKILDELIDHLDTISTHEQIAEDLRGQATALTASDATANKSAIEDLNEKADVAANIAIDAYAMARKAYRNLNTYGLPIKIRNRYGEGESPLGVRVIQESTPQISGIHPVEIDVNKPVNLKVFGKNFRFNNSDTITGAMIGDIEQVQLSVDSPEQITLTTAKPIGHAWSDNEPKKPIILVGKDQQIVLMPNNETPWVEKKRAVNAGQGFVTEYFPKKVRADQAFDVTVIGSGFSGTSINASIGNVTATEAKVMNPKTIYLKFAKLGDSLAGHQGKVAELPIVIIDDNGLLQKKSMVGLHRTSSPNLPSISIDSSMVTGTPRAAMWAAIPKRINPVSDFSITVVGYGFIDERQKPTILAASIGGLSASKITTTNSGSLELAFKGVGKDQVGKNFNLQEPLILIGNKEIGVLSVSHPAKQPFMMEIEGGRQQASTAENKAPVKKESPPEKKEMGITKKAGMLDRLFGKKERIRNLFGTHGATTVSGDEPATAPRNQHYRFSSQR